MRRYLIAGNWKMNKGPKETAEFLERIKDLSVNSNVEALICVPFIDICEAVNKSSESLSIGAQNMFHEQEGAFTGEISPKMLNECGVKYVIIGHSERRSCFKESDEEINLKLLSALKNNIKPILCVGETLEERKSGNYLKKVLCQVEKDLKDVSKDDAEGIVIAYEPIWAIGTGLTASENDAQEMCMEIRKKLAEIFGGEVSDGMRILYGGSVKPGNIESILSRPDVDGALIGGASLNPDDFRAMVEAGEKL